MTVRTTGTRLAVAGFAGSFGVWALCFTALYAVLSVGCAWNWQEVSLGGLSALRLALIVLWFTHLALLVGLFAAQWRQPAESASAPTTIFLRRAGHATTAAAFCAILWLGLTLHTTQICT